MRGRFEEEIVGENFDRSAFRNKAEGFDEPAMTATSAETAKRWQDANRTWWEETPMRYDWRMSIPGQPGTREYYEEIDRRFLDRVKQFMPWNEVPFDALIPYPELADMDVLEIGVGQGTVAQLIASRSRSFAGIDLTQAACDSTRKRFQLSDIRGDIRQMDAEAIAFPDQSFDFIWSWGVIHHSANTEQILREMHRVLRPGGRAALMVYYRSFVQYYLIGALARGLLRREFWKIGGIHKINQAATDGALARFFSVPEFSGLLDGKFSIDRIWVTGQKADAIALPDGRLKASMIDHLPNALTRFVTDRLRLGTFLVATVRRN